MYWGLDAPVARMAAQIHLESAWQPAARNPIASGLGQFTAGTAATMARLYPELHPAAPFDSGWSLRAVVIYDLHLHRGLRPRGAAALDDCARWAMVLAAYNGGPGWIERDRTLTTRRGGDPDRWWGHVAAHSGRAPHHHRRNRWYVVRVLCELERRYLVAGWPGEGCP